jgi:hypothetical protein
VEGNRVGQNIFQSTQGMLGIKFMSKPMLISLGVLLVVFGSGVALGLFMAGAPATSDASEKSAGSSSSVFFSSPEAQDQVQANTLLSDRIRELEKELSEQKENSKAIQADRLAFLKKYHDQIRVQAFGGNPIKITPEMAEILGLTKDEQQTIEQHLTEAAKEMERLQDANKVLTMQTANSITIETPVDAEGKAIETTLNDTLASDIGADRADFLMNSAGSYYSDPFSGFAQQKIEMEISWTEQNGAPLYTWKETGFNSNGMASGWSSSTGSSVPQQYQRFLQGDSAP